MTSLSNAVKPRSIPNSPAWPNLIPTSFACLRLSPCLENNQEKTNGFIKTKRKASSKASKKVLSKSARLKPAPSAKKNSTKKKSLTGFNFSAKNSEAGEDANATPATNPPTSYDRFIDSKIKAHTEHQPIAKRKRNS